MIYYTIQFKFKNSQKFKGNDYSDKRESTGYHWKV